MSDRAIGINQIQLDKLWLIYHIFPIIEQKENKKVLIWGAGTWGKAACEWTHLMNEQIEFAGLDVSDKLCKLFLKYCPLKLLRSYP